MKVAVYVGITFLAMTMTLSCNQSGTKKQQSNEYEQSPQKEQDQMPDESEQNSTLFQQPSQATEVSDKELEQFAVVAQQVQIINLEVQQKMINTVEEKGLDVQRFGEIQQAQQNPQQEIDATPEEVEKYEASTRELEKIQGQAQQEMEGKITEGGLTIPRYQEIAMTLQSDPDLQERFQIIQQQNN